MLIYGVNGSIINFDTYNSIVITTDWSGGGSVARIYAKNSYGNALLKEIDERATQKEFEEIESLEVRYAKNDSASARDEVEFETKKLTNKICERATNKAKALTKWMFYELRTKGFCVISEYRGE